MGVTLTSPRPAHASLNWDATIEADLAALRDGINSATPITGDLNSVTTGGTYRGSSLTNAPTSGGYLLLVIPGASSATQLAFGTSPDTAAWRRTLFSGTWSAWAQIQMVTDTGWAVAPITAASGWGTRTDPDGNTTGTLTGGVRNLNGLIEYRFQLTRTGADITSTGSGNIAGDPTIATVNPTTYPNLVPASHVEGRFGILGVQAGTARIDKTGAITISDIYPDDSIANGSTIQVTLFGLAG